MKEADVEGAGQQAARTVRCFIAVDLAPEVLGHIGALQRQLSAANADVRWVRPQGMHATLKFLGSVDSQRLPSLQSSLTAAVGSHPPLRLQAQRLGAFPNLRRPRVLWVGVGGKGLAELAHDVDVAMQPLGFEPEARAFYGHVTLGRVNSRRGWGALEELFKAHMDDDFGATDVRSVVLYQSKLQSGGSVYTALWTIPLQQNKGTRYDA